MSDDRFLSVKQVSEITSLNRATVYRKVAAREMPAPVRVTERRIAFRESELRAWMDARERVAVPA